MDTTPRASLEYVNKRTSIQRTSGSWLDDGFLATTDNITIAGTTYSVAAVTATEIFLVETYDLDPGAANNVTCSATVDSTTTHLNFTARQEAALPEINWEGNWGDEGIYAGDTITISGADESGNNGSFTIDSIENGLLELETGSSLVDDLEDNSSQISVEKEVEITSQLTFTAKSGAGNATITNSGGWDSALFQAGRVITLSGAGSNSGPYTIESVSGNILTLSDDDDLSAGTDPNGASFTVNIEITGSISFAAERFYQDATIERTTGTWSDNYQAGRSLEISGAHLAANNGTYTILSVSGNTITLNENLSTDTPANDQNATVAVQVSTILDINYVTNNAEIIRSTGDWNEDSFTAGQTLYIEHSDNNDGKYLIDSVTDTRLQLSLSDDLTTDTEDSSTSDTSIHTDAVQVVQVPAGRTMDLICGTNGERDRIEFTDSGDFWKDLNFLVGQYIQITGTAGGENDGLYQIDYVAVSLIHI